MKRLQAARPAAGRERDERALFHVHFKYVGSKLDKDVT